MSELIQAAVIAEVNEFLGRIVGVPARSTTGYRDGYEEQRTISYGSTPVAIRRPRVRQSDTPFESEILPPYKRCFPAKRLPGLVIGCAAGCILLACPAIAKTMPNRLGSYEFSTVTFPNSPENILRIRLARREFRGKLSLVLPILESKLANIS